MCVVITSRPEFKMGHVGSKTRSLGQYLEKPCVLSRMHSFGPVFMKLCQNDFLTLNKYLSRQAMLYDDSSCLTSFLALYLIILSAVLEVFSFLISDRYNVLCHVLFIISYATELSMKHLIYLVTKKFDKV